MMLPSRLPSWSVVLLAAVGLFHHFAIAG